MKIAIIGHQNITGFLTKELLEMGHSIDYLIGLDNKNSHLVTDYLDVSILASDNNIKCFHPQSYSLKDDDSIKFFQENKFDILIVVGWSRLIPDKILNSVKFSTLGWHGGMFKPPRCRGRAVVNWCLINNHEKFYIYTMNLKPGIDDGDIYDVREINVSNEDTSKTLYFKCGIVLVDLFNKILKNIDELQPKKQTNEGATYLPKRNKENGGIDWTKDADSIRNLIRGLSDPFPNAFSDSVGCRVFFKSSKVFDIYIKDKLIPGRIYFVFHDLSFVVACSDKLLYVSSYSSNNDFVPYKGFEFKMVSGEFLEAENY